MKHSYALTELGIVSALGIGCAETERRLFAGDTGGMRAIELAGGDTTRFGFAAALPPCDTPPPMHIAALLDAAIGQLDLAALYREIPHDRVGAVIGTSNSTMEEFTDNPDTINMGYPAERLKTVWGVGGPAWSVSTACSSSAKVFASARRLLESRICDAVLVGGADAHTRTVVEGFHALEALAPDLTRPLAADRNGINLGEGAAVFIMRRANAGVFVAGVGESSDAYHLTAPDPSGRGAEEAMRAALSDAGMNAEDVDYVNLHGTGTVYNDAMECAAVRRVFGDRIACSSTKPLTGHCLGAAGAIEAALVYLALKRGSGLPPHVTDAVDPILAPFRIPRVGDDTPVRTALSNSFAFGGSNASVLLTTRYEDVHDLLPQREPMVLLDDYEPPASDDAVTSLVRVTPSSPFYEAAGDGVPSCVALEYMAQTMALLIGLRRRAAGLPPKIGFVLGSRNLALRIPFFRNGETYRVTVRSSYQDDEYGAFDCTIVDAQGNVAAEGTLTAYQPEKDLS